MIRTTTGRSDAARTALALTGLGCTAVLVTTACSPSSSPHHKPTTVTASPHSISATVDNPWFPLTPGRTLVYSGVKDGTKSTEYLTTSRETQNITGIPCRVVLDRLYLGRTLHEATRDYYAQDATGNVWYFGEDTAELDTQGNMVSTEGTWHAGQNDARPGIFLPAHPVPGAGGQQEYYPGQAEDHFQVLNLTSRVSVPYKTFTGTLRTKEWTPLEPGVVDNKYYVKGIGTVKEITVKGGPFEENVLIAVRG
ncbi:hypothetical protein PO587_44085 [Streptomyces gilvifuscus]|uniref:Lipoprotein n=1 Tax=Streptomyces gilvifuscus TaxID=1550617 RepID=A0ABT5G954_9ACTN|nr:hypothetical protein [Streptomyces gilvifuscus]MDC2961423.1 hypothetical protein [Streptomyces gilvifuscus]